MKGGAVQCMQVPGLQRPETRGSLLHGAVTACPAYSIVSDEQVPQRLTTCAWWLDLPLHTVCNEGGPCTSQSCTLHTLYNRQACWLLCCCYRPELLYCWLYCSL
uniref:Uncharacterized protein n=1 Tax=Chlamydomonas chlamydogama TaxID=225041 RepID=A0A7S2VVF9_9CHLO